MTKLDRIVARVEYHPDSDNESIDHLTMEAIVDASAILAFEDHIDGSFREWVLGPQPLRETYRLCYEALRSPHQMRLRRLAGTDHLRPRPDDPDDDAAAIYAAWVDTVAIADIRDEFPVGDAEATRYTSRAAQDVVAIAMATGQPVDAVLDAPVEVWDELGEWARRRAAALDAAIDGQSLVDEWNTKAKAAGAA